jgi:2-polyprenyl-3-methyl-5-hydroxy-6-metoxy-1,4-benzoquinol methylase
MPIKKLLKKIYASLFCLNQPVMPQLASLYEKLRLPGSQRWFYYGRIRKMTYCYDAEAAPGMLETVLLALQPSAAPTKKLLDYGCGKQMGEPYRQLGFTVETCDVLPLPAKQFTLINPRAKKIPYADNSFDYVVASEVIEHVTSPFELLEEFVRVTRNSVVITTPNPASLHSCVPLLTCLHVAD